MSRLGILRSGPECHPKRVPLLRKGGRDGEVSRVLLKRGHVAGFRFSCDGPRKPSAGTGPRWEGARAVESHSTDGASKS